ncbi:hypothetical protein [Curtobacterium sp. JUb34]|uniref:hypothetical protein n=1 Tax=Curtobacterium sp. JUb34 TaxID=2485109 RepID=UPI0011CE6AC3|nr:hypothetical protein [Curtobacterium sp. JUb34]
MGEMSEIARLVDTGAIEAAVAEAQGLTPDRVADLLFASGGFAVDMAPYDAFVRRWYERLDSPYLRAAAAERFGDAYLTELAGVPGGEEFAAELTEAALRAVIAHTGRMMRGPAITDWAEPHVAVMSTARARSWREASMELAKVHLPE